MPSRSARRGRIEPQRHREKPCLSSLCLCGSMRFRGMTPRGRRLIHDDPRTARPAGGRSRGGFDAVRPPVVRRRRGRGAGGVRETRGPTAVAERPGRVALSGGAQRARSAARSERRRRHHEADAAARRPAWFAPKENAALDGETAAAALETLPIEEREVVVAHLWGGLSFGQIGRMAGVSTSTAHRRYLKALSALRERLHVPCPNPSNPD